MDFSFTRGTDRNSLGGRYCLPQIVLCGLLLVMTPRGRWSRVLLLLLILPFLELASFGQLLYESQQGVFCLISLCLLVEQGWISQSVMVCQYSLISSPTRMYVLFDYSIQNF